MKNFFRWAFLVLAVVGILQRCARAAYASVASTTASSDSSPNPGVVTVTLTLENDNAYAVAGFRQIRVVISGSSSGPTGYQAFQGEIKNGSGAWTQIANSTSSTVSGGYGPLVVADGTAFQIKAVAHSVNGGSYNETTASWTAGAGPPPTTPGAGNKKTLTFTYHNASTTLQLMAGIESSAEPGKVFQMAFVAPGADYHGAITVEAADTATYTVVVIDMGAALDAGGGYVDGYYDESDKLIAIDFAGFTTAVGTGQTSAANGVAAGQASASTVAPAEVLGATAETVSAKGAATNPRHVPTGGISGRVTAATKDDVPSQATQAANTNAITGALKDVQEAIKGGLDITVTPTDMTATNTKLDTINNSIQARVTETTAQVSAANVKLEAGNTLATAANTKLDTLSTGLATVNTSVLAGTAQQVVTNTKLDSVVSNVAASTAATASLVSGQTATNTKLDTINTSIGGLGTKLDTANGHLSKVSTFVDGTHPSQTGYSNAAQVSAGQSAAAGVGAYSGKKATVSGALSSSIPGSTADWGPSFMVGSTSITFGVMHMSPTMDSLMVAGRSILLLAMCLGFCRASSGLVTDYTVAMPQVLAQDTGFGPENIGPGVSQAKTYATAAAAVGIIFAGVASIIAIVDTFVTYYGGGIGAIFSALNFPAASTAGALDRFVPLAAGLGLTVLGVALPYVVAPVYLATAGVLRFIKT